MQEIERPKKRSNLRLRLGKEYFIIKRRYEWLFGSKKYARVQSNNEFEHLVFKHQSFVMRPLKDLEMYLQKNKKTNLQLAIQHINGIEIKPDEVFSIWRLVGRPTRRKGYLEGLILKSGQLDKDIGGGLCQLGNLLFWIFAHSPLEVIERYRHGYDVFPDVKRKVPFGAGATLSYNYIDLQVKNVTKNSFIIKLWLDDAHLHGALYAQEPLSATYKVVERNHHMKQQMWGGYSRHNQIFKVKIEGGVETEELIVENHAIMMYQPFLK